MRVRTKRGTPWGVVGALFLVAGCGTDLPDDYLVGDQGRIAVSLGGCLSCEPVGLLVGASRKLTVYWVAGRERVAAGDDIVFDSADPDLLTAQLGEESTGRPAFDVDALAPGEARLVFRNHAGELLDTVGVHVAEPTRLLAYADTVTREEVSEVNVAVGEEIVVYVEAYDELGLLLDLNHWTWAVDDVEVASLWSPGAALVGGAAQVDRVENTSSSVYVRGERAGTTTLHVLRGDVVADVTVNVGP